MQNWNIHNALIRNTPKQFRPRHNQVKITYNNFDNDPPQPRLDYCYKIAASAVKEYGEIYLGIFQKLHIEIENRERNNSLLNIAFSVATSSHEIELDH